MTKKETIIETLAYLPFNYLMRLLARDILLNFVALSSLDYNPIYI
jgi:hypothetical protein